MKSYQTALYFSATDLSNFLACRQVTLLDRALEVDGLHQPPRFDDPGLEVLKLRGEEHERAYLARLRSEGKSVEQLAAPSPGLPYQERWERHAASTVAAMRRGVDVISQAALFDETWVGKADFLVRVEEPSEVGDWSYEVVDAKLAREAKGGALLQVLLYADLLTKAQGRAPERVHLVLGGPETREQSFRVADYAAYFRSVRDRFLRHVAEAGGAGPGRSAPLPVAPDPVAHCDICLWRVRCDRERREVDHLSLVANISSRQRDALRERGVNTLEALARLPLPIRPRLDGVSNEALARVREQARIQAEARPPAPPIHELLEYASGEGLAALPEPSPGDLFFDIEGDPFAFTHGLEYLLGWVDAAGEYTCIRALDPDQEKAAFERFVDVVMARWAEHPGMHVYHYAPYEETTLKRLAGLHGTREDEVDRLLRADVLVDLYRIVRQGIRASVESYSIKDLESLYGFERAVELREASRALADFQAWLELGQSGGDETLALLERIEGYNCDDCLSTVRLREWLEEQRAELERRVAEPIPRPGPGEGDATESVQEDQEEVARLVARLTDGVPAEEANRTEEQHARWLLAQMLGYHRREEKSTWWEYFRCRDDLSDLDRVEDRATLGGLEYHGAVDKVKRSLVHRYRFPLQDHRFRVGDKCHDPATGRPPGEIVGLNDAEGWVDLKRSASSEVPHPKSLIPYDYVGTDEQQKSLRRLAASICDGGLGDDSLRRSAVDLLLGRAPRCGQPAGQPLVREGEDTLEAACRLVASLDRSVLAIQGPPGSGKTYTGARMIVRLIRAGKRVGVTALSHKVITKLLDEVSKAADEEGFELRGVQKPSSSGDDSGCEDERIELVSNNRKVYAALADGSVSLAAGTAWLWSPEEAVGIVDVLFVDEAGQFSLADALAVSQAAASLVLLGDPAQLDRPQKGSHPPGSAASALEHMLGDDVTMPDDRGLFLARTWRLHPGICRFTSEIYYGARLEPRPGLEAQALGGGDALAGAGLRVVPVSHTGNQSESNEEVAVVRELMGRLLAEGRTWTDRDGVPRELRIGDILIVAPYNAQVDAIAAALPEDARVGTVDRFQGQQAPVVIYSTASSSAAEAPRGMDFLYNPNRLNVATSRAQCAAFIVASQALFAPECRSPKQMRLANGFCRYRELAGVVEIQVGGIIALGG